MEMKDLVYQDEHSEEKCGCRLIHQDRVAAARKSALTDEENARLSLLYKAFGDVTRLRIIRALDQGEMCVCDLAAFLGVSESAVSHQLRLLRQLHLVTNRRHGPILYYRLDDDHISQLVHLALEHIRE